MWCVSFNDQIRLMLFCWLVGVSRSLLLIIMTWRLAKKIIAAVTFCLYGCQYSIVTTPNHFPIIIVLKGKIFIFLTDGRHCSLPLHFLACRYITIFLVLFCKKNNNLFAIHLWMATCIEYVHVHVTFNLLINFGKLKKKVHPKISVFREKIKRERILV